MQVNGIQEKPAEPEQHVTYIEAVQRGDYDLNNGGLVGKYDNVRTYWEDQLTRIVLRPYLAQLVARKRQAHEKLRIIDLGAGTGQGYDLLTRIARKDLDLGLHHDWVLEKQDVECYFGIDLSAAMVSHGNEIWADDETVRFEQGDLRDRLGVAKDEAPFDIYHSAYGSLSHLVTDDLRALLIDIAQHGRDGSLVVLDLLGRYSLEWPGYWTATTDAEKFADYSMSYLQLATNSLESAEHFPIRFWIGSEIDTLIQEVVAESGVKVEILKKYDRSLMVGRHFDTRAYNPDLPPMRQAVNRLHEDYRRTNIDHLHMPMEDVNHPDPTADALFTELIYSWNTLVDFFGRRLLDQDVSLVEMEGWDDFAAPLQFALMTVDRVINNTSWMWYGDPRANMIEPQLGYALRSLEHKLQRGMGCGHGFLVVLKLDKS